VVVVVVRHEGAGGGWAVIVVVVGEGVIVLPKSGSVQFFQGFSEPGT
jgi:hypothetical protein